MPKNLKFLRGILLNICISAFHTLFLFHLSNSLSLSFPISEQGVSLKMCVESIALSLKKKEPSRFETFSVKSIEYSGWKLSVLVNTVRSQ